jgi:hypothetical protein
MPPPALSDSEITTVMAASRPLALADRDRFLNDVYAVLATQSVLGDGIVARVCREVQRRYLDPPLSTTEDEDHPRAHRPLRVTSSKYG